MIEGDRRERIAQANGKGAPAQGFFAPEIAPHVHLWIIVAATIHISEGGIMAKKVTITLVDDIDGTSSADETAVLLARWGELDRPVLGQCRQLRDALAIYVANAERIGGRKSTGRAASGNGRKQVGDVREGSAQRSHRQRPRPHPLPTSRPPTTRRTPEQAEALTREHPLADLL